MKNEWNLEDYKIIDDIKYKGIIPTFLIILIIIGIFFIICKFNFKVYEKVLLINENNNFMLITNSEKIKSIEDNNYIYIGGGKYNYKVLKTDIKYEVIDNVIYQTIYLDIKNFDTSSKTLNAYFLKSNKTLFQKLIEFIWKGEK